MKHLTIAIVTVAALNLIGLAWLAYDWLTIGYGLHPAICGALGAVCVGIVAAWLHISAKDEIEFPVLDLV